MKEIEIKILEIDEKNIRKILKNKKAKLIKKILQTNIIYSDKDTLEEGITIRLRKEGKKTYFAIKLKKKIVRGHKVRKEYEMEISSFKIAESMLKSLGLKISSYIEIKREYYQLNNCSVEIIKMPQIPFYLEIEGKEKNIEKVAKILGYSKKDYFLGFAPIYYKVGFKDLRFK
ncbi:class IV adenylate cyclase [archaeon]|jgi:predicted adenylyl cyclase CyaB|nr:class IV adenylate cyclase [archaeon]MBT4373468.1 class IV adenylate cyclase [archaeon]MBT4531916.1 class IV adenylate cyclase [archaeon]MBT7001583.1 class IV adenylate cyclase [archaeon]MBT7282525.1 class IV adenylate cyclase [archaeon]